MHNAQNNVLRGKFIQVIIIIVLLFFFSKIAIKLLFFLYHNNAHCYHYRVALIKKYTII